MGDIGFSVVGLGMGRGRAKLIRTLEGARLVSVVDLRADLATEVAEELGCAALTSADDALADDRVDVLVVMTPSGMHADLAVRALDAGKHVITTKPMDVTVERCDLMLAAQARSGRLLAVDFQRRFEERYARARYAIDQNLLGRLLMGEARLKWYRTQDYYDRGGWRGTWKMDGGGSLANQTIHEIDLLRWLMGKPKTVVGRIGRLNHQIETEDVGLAIIAFESGAVGTIVGTTTFTCASYEGLEIHGTEGGLLTTVKPERWEFVKGHEDRAEQLRRCTPFANTFENMVAALRDGAPLVCDGNEGRNAIELLNAIYDSARHDSRPVNL